jgi:hypothetical protein
VDPQTACWRLQVAGISPQHRHKFLGCHRPPRSLAPSLLGTGEELGAGALVEATTAVSIGSARRDARLARSGCS